jgi:D-aminopeptidase
VANDAPLAMHNRAHLSAQFINDEYFDGLYAGAVDSVEEAIVNALIAAQDTPTIKNPADRVCRALPQQQLVDIMRRHGRCA